MTEDIKPSENKLVIYCAHPSYANGDKHSHKQFWVRALNPEGKYAQAMNISDDKGSSLLADAFNEHWEMALNLQLGGNPISYFIMLHDDIVPEDWWVDKLLDEIIETKADMISVAVPIKDKRGLASVAVNDPKDEWEVHRRLTLPEIHSLPETFGTQDLVEADFSPSLNHRLLVNSGCWICDFTKTWRFKVHFEVKNRMTFILSKDNVRIPNINYEPWMQGSWGRQVMPEDWLFSRQLNALGCDVRCTRKIRVDHIGLQPYPNNQSHWGIWNSDEDLRRKWDKNWQLPPVGVRGWLSQEEGQGLARLARGKNVLEIGSYCGLSTIWMARSASHVTAVDTFKTEGYPMIPGADTLEEFRRNLKTHGVEDKVTVVVSKSSEACSHLQLYAKYDMVFIDGSHDYNSVKSDTLIALENLKDEGQSLLVLHDYSWRDPEVRRWIDNILEGGLNTYRHRISFKLLEKIDTIAVVKPTRTKISSVYPDAAEEQHRAAEIKKNGARAALEPKDSIEGIESSFKEQEFTAKEISYG